MWKEWKVILQLQCKTYAVWAFKYACSPCFVTIHCIPRSAEMAALTKLATPPMKKPTTAIRIPFMVNVWLKSESVKKTIIINYSRKIGMMKCIKSYANLTPGSSLFLNKITVDYYWFELLSLVSDVAHGPVVFNYFV